MKITKLQLSAVLLAALLTSGTYLWAQAVPGPEEAGKEFISYLARRDMASLKNIIAQDSINRLGEKGVNDLIKDLRLVPTRWESRAEGSTAQITPIFEAQPVICRRQGRFWRVDLIATATRWLKTPAGEAALVRQYSHLPVFGVESRNICAGNLKALSVALRQYSEDYDNHYPPLNRWTTALNAFVTKPTAFHCPAAGKNTFGYAINGKISKLSTYQMPLAPKIPSTIVFYESTRLQPNISGTGADFAFRHEKAAQALLSDGSIHLFDAKMGFPKRF